MKKRPNLEPMTGWLLSVASASVLFACLLYGIFRVPSPEEDIAKRIGKAHAPESEKPAAQPE